MTQPGRHVKPDFLCVLQLAGCYNLNMTPDSALLRQFADTNSEAAFAELVRRHVNLVFSAALRQVNGDEHLAKDVAQTVFTDLARKADSLARRENLTGWLYTSAHFAAAKMVRGENRRRDREEKFMREPNETAPEADWEKLRPTLDAAMHELKETDREAILLRYFENQPFIQVGAKLGLNENAARMRVERALEKLRDIFTKRGVTTAAALASVISANAIQMAPANLAATLTTASIAGVGTGTFTLLKIMTMTKLKLGLSARVVAGAATALVVQHQVQEKLRADNESLAQQIGQLRTDNESLSNRLAATGDAKSLSDAQYNELLKLRGEVGVLRRQLIELGKLRDENQQFQRQATVGQNQAIQISPQDQFRLNQFHATDDLKQLGLAMRVFSGDHNGQFATNFFQLNDELGGEAMVTNFMSKYEFVNAGLVNLSMPDDIIFREQNSHKDPSGAWERIYTFADGSVQTQYSDDGNFDAYEKQHTIPPPQ
jgi:RNA polymerase sigma factor (sigma-70 family)